MFILQSMQGRMILFRQRKLVVVHTASYAAKSLHACSDGFILLVSMIVSQHGTISVMSVMLSGYIFAPLFIHSELLV